MAVVVAIFGILHFLFFVGISFLFIYLFKKEQYKKTELLKFFIALPIVSLIGFFVSNHLALLSDDATYATTLGFSIVPLVQIVISLFSYIIIQVLNRKKELNYKYAPIFLGVFGSAPITFLLTALFAENYWNFLGRSVYG